MDVLVPRAKTVILTRPDNARATSAAELVAHVPKDFRKQRVEVAESVDDAIRRARDITPDDDLILIAGSLYLVGEARRILLESRNI